LVTWSWTDVSEARRLEISDFRVADRSDYTQRLR
jgi:hypothetical protein